MVSRARTLVNDPRATSKGVPARGAESQHQQRVGRVLSATSERQPAKDCFSFHARSATSSAQRRRAALLLRPDPRSQQQPSARAWNGDNAEAVSGLLTTEMMSERAADDRHPVLGDVLAHHRASKQRIASSDVRPRQIARFRLCLE